MKPFDMIKTKQGRVYSVIKSKTIDGTEYAAVQELGNGNLLIAKVESGSLVFENNPQKIMEIAKKLDEA